MLKSTDLPPAAGDPACGERGLDSPEADDGGPLSPLAELEVDTGPLELLLELLL